eukprot:g22213.t1
MAVRSTGCALLSAHNPQEVMDMGLVAHLASLKSSSAVSANKYYDAVPEIVQEVMDQVAVITGRHYKLFEYYGDPEAERVVVLMGSAAKTAEETVDYLRARGEKVGILKVHLFRPFSTEHFLAELPDTATGREDLAPSLPLHADVLTAMSEAGVYKKVVGGNYGLGSKEFAPSSLACETSLL